MIIVESTWAMHARRARPARRRIRNTIGQSEMSDDEEYEDDFEEEDERKTKETLDTCLSKNEYSSQGWKSISFDDVTVGKRIGGGGVGVIYRGFYNGEAVALKTLFDPRVDDDLKQEYMDELFVMR